MRARRGHGGPFGRLYYDRGGVSLLAAQPQPATQQRPSFRSGVDIVRLDVSVLDKDPRPVRGLSAADFAVTVDGMLQPIVAFDAVVVPPREEPTALWMRDVAPDVRNNALGEPRLFVLLFTMNNSHAQEFTGDRMQQMADLVADLDGIQAATRFAPVPIYGFSIAPPRHRWRYHGNQRHLPHPRGHDRRSRLI